jgi:hypothetical protein
MIFSEDWKSLSAVSVNTCILVAAILLTTFKEENLKKYALHTLRFKDGFTETEAFDSRNSFVNT